MNVNFLEPFICLDFNDVKTLEPVGTNAIDF